jgi:hypothetical protein
MFKKLVIAGVLAMPAPSYASPPMPHESIQAITAALPECTGGWIETDWRGRVFPMDLAPRLSLLSSPSNALDQDAGQDLYQIAKGLLAPATGVHDRMMDGDASLKCPAHAKEAVALMEYLVDEKPDAWRGATNAFEWLGLAYESEPQALKTQRKPGVIISAFASTPGLGQRHVGLTGSITAFWVTSNARV